jgi:uridine phosphorylase
MVIARFGTCGTPQTDIPIGSICVASKVFIFDYLHY